MSLRFTFCSVPGLVILCLSATPSSADTIKYEGDTDFDAFSVPFFDSSLGSLNSVWANYSLDNVSFNFVVAVNDFSTSEPIPYAFDVNVEHQLDGLPAIVTPITETTHSFSGLAPNPFQFGVGQVRISFFDTISGSHHFSGQAAASFIGTGTYDILPLLSISCVNTNEVATVVQRIDSCNLNPFSPNNVAITYDFSPIQPNPIPVPAAIWLFGSALAGLLGFSNRISF